MKVIQGKKVEISYKFMSCIIMISIVCIAMCFMLYDIEAPIRNGVYLVIISITVLFLITFTVALMVAQFIVYGKHYRMFDVYCQQILKLSKFETETKRDELKQQSIAIFEHANRFKPSQKLKLDYLFSSTPYRFTLDEKMFVVDRLEALGLNIEIDKLGVLHYTI